MVSDAPPTAEDYEDRVAIVGAGPAGLMAAELLASNGQRVVVFERMPSPSRKFLMAGRGGLNLTHSEPLERLLARYRQTGGALDQAIRDCSPGQVLDWVHGLGQETFVGSSGRVFPKCLKASPLLRAWLIRLRDLGVVIKLRHTWRGWDAAGRLLVDHGELQPMVCQPRATILAVGGASWPRLGSDGAWVSILAEERIPVAPLIASNCAVKVTWSDHFRSKFAGHALKRIALTCGTQRQRGEAVITQLGLEGGAVYALTPAIRIQLFDNGRAELRIDLRPDEPVASLADRLSRPRGKQSLATALRKTLALSPVAIALLREASRHLPTDVGELAKLIKSVPITVTRLADMDRAISTAGGVEFDAIDDNFMLRAKPGVFVAGEMLDWDAPTGGYLLQATFSTGHAAAVGVLRWIADTAATQTRLGASHSQPADRIAPNTSE